MSKPKKENVKNQVKIIVKSVANGNQNLYDAMIPVILEDLKKTHTLDNKKGMS